MTIIEGLAVMFGVLIAIAGVGVLIGIAASKWLDSTK